MRPRTEAAEPGGGRALGASAPPLFVPGEKVPFLGMKVLCFHRIEVPFLQNLSALFGQCPLTFEVLSRPLSQDVPLLTLPDRYCKSDKKGQVLPKNK